MGQMLPASGILLEYTDQVLQPRLNKEPSETVEQAATIVSQ